MSEDKIFLQGRRLYGEAGAGGAGADSAAAAEKAGQGSSGGVRSCG